MRYKIHEYAVDALICAFTWLWVTHFCDFQYCSLQRNLQMSQFFISFWRAHLLCELVWMKLTLTKILCRVIFAHMSCINVNMLLLLFVVYYINSYIELDVFSKTIKRWFCLILSKLFITNNYKYCWKYITTVIFQLIVIWNGQSNTAEEKVRLHSHLPWDISSCCV